MRRTQMLVSRPWVLSVLGLASLLAAGCDPPTGPNLAAFTCKCHDQASGGPIVLDARRAPRLRGAMG